MTARRKDGVNDVPRRKDETVWNEALSEVSRLRSDYNLARSTFRASRNRLRRCRAELLRATERLELLSEAIIAKRILREKRRKRRK